MPTNERTLTLPELHALLREQHEKGVELHTMTGPGYTQLQDRPENDWAMEKLRALRAASPPADPV